MRVTNPPMTAGAIVALLHALTGADELSHDELKDQSINDHHTEAHTLAGHSSEAHSELTDVGEADHHDKFTPTEHTTIGNGAPHHAGAHSLSSHASRGHDSLTGVSSNQHHAQMHPAASHNDQGATGAELEALTDGSTTSLHAHPLMGSTVGTLTRVLTAASGDVSYSGFGFRPRAIIFCGCVDVDSFAFVGLSDAVGDGGGFHINMTTTVARLRGVVHFETANNVYQDGALWTINSDGFTLRWTKQGSPTGTGTFYALCLK